MSKFLPLSIDMGDKNETDRIISPECHCIPIHLKSFYLMEETLTPFNVIGKGK